MKSRASALDEGSAQLLRRLIAVRGARHLAEVMDLSRPAVERAAAGGLVTRATRILIGHGLQRMRAAGELPEATS